VALLHANKRKTFGTWFASYHCKAVRRKLGETMNPNMSDTQQPKKHFAPNAGAPSRMQEKDASQEQSTKITPLREASAQKSEKRSDDSPSSPSKKEVSKEQPAKEPTLIDNLDLALMNTSIAIGDWVKKIEALSPKEGAIARASKFTVSNLQTVQNYIGDNSTKEIAESAWRFVRRSPLPVGLAIVGAGVGLYLTKNVLKAAAPETATQA
jgi:hypothetical protein